MIFKMLKLILSLLSIGLSSAQILQNGQCNINVELENNFNLDRFTGKWYSIEGTVSPLQTGDCSNLEINPANDTGTFDVYIRAVNQNFGESINGTATAQNGTATFSMNLTSIDKTIDFHIMITNYDNYALAYSCENVGNTSRNIYIWQLGRDTSFPAEMITNLMNQTIFTYFQLTSADLTVTVHSESACYELPVIPPGQVVILPGQCDPNTTVVQNFRVDQFQGVWHQIASYYSPDSVGLCNRAEYTLRGSVVDVVNSEVISQRLSTIIGNATISSNDASARLLVTLEIAPNVYAQSPLWILSTDYFNYAVSYTCADLPNNRKQVSSWILSRTRQLSAAAQVDVNRVISSYLDLNDQYYIQADQSDAACFYYPDPVPDQSVIFRGQCDENIPVVANFSVVDYLGLWHTIEAYPSVNALGSCGNAEYSLGQGGTVDVYNTEVINQALLTIDGIAELASTDGSAKLNVTFPIVGTNFTISTNYWVLVTDYRSYALVYSCSNINADQKMVFAWKLSRTKQMPAIAPSIFEQTMRNISVLDQRYFQTNDQSDAACFYYPDPQPGMPVVFPGQCDDNIPAINDFNATSFIGTWYEIEAYPKENQPGQCINHLYTLSSNGLDITTTSVDDQFLIVSNSTVAVNGTSGRLSINIPANGTVITIPFWILSVDYQDYALAYSCVNLNPDARAVYSWKLSRSTQLSTAANNAINNVISNINVLEPRYYENVSQSADACFFLPDLAPGEPVILNGQCDPNIQAVQNFSVADYQGRWRLIESYPSDFQTGTCNEARYTPINGSDILEVVNSHVINSSLTSITGTAFVDSSGRVTVTFPSTSASMQLLVLDTDYRSYSLAYSCENITNNTRRVWSWKMSRTRNLTDTAISNMNRIIDSIQVLNNKYYERVNQTDEGCFYFPEPGTNPVVFRGQCDQNITAISNFNATAYLGLWHTIASYPSVFQDGSCINAYYSPGTTSDVDVYNTQVIGQRLDEMRGTANLTSTDGTGKLLVSFPIAGTNLSALSEYWILDTDYSSYALVYTCVDIDDESRQVWSWKLGRNKNLTTAATNAMNNVISRIPVLDQKYYIDNDQSADGCFYYPDPRPGVVVEFPGQCDESIQAVPNFNLTAFQGTWNEIQAYPKEQQTGQCINHEYNLAGTNNLSLITRYVLNQLLETTSSSVTFSSTQDTSGKLTVTINTGGTVVSFPFWILSTDYTDYALAYSCVNVNSDSRRVFSWKLSRSQNLSTSANTAINSAISNIDVLEQRYYENIDQSDSACFFLPNITLYEPVIFPGQCDPNIAVVSNFNVARYQGRWRTISTYYAEQQKGACGQAEYSLRGNVVDLVNSEVINQALFTVSGTATLATNDSSAKLEVIIGNNTANLWILDTDYDTYSIAYSCNNLPNNQRRVFSWILSRTPSLPAQAANNINRVVESINVLNNRYYQSVDQSDSACFYYPVPDPSRPVIFRGQCDQNITVVTDFNITQYMGRWFDIASYPSTFQNGSCDTADYTLRGSEVDVVNSQVVNETLATARAVGRFAGATNIAKLLVNFGANDSDYWVLSTDYSSYALVYNCKNIDSERRQVETWKLSRTRQLTANAVTAINNTMAAIPVLDDRYYVTRDHSASGCFFYPVPQPGSPVVFPGQCDTNIQAMPNFNLTSFQGIWHEIEKYHTDHQSGQCINQEFLLSTGNTLNLVSRNVQNQSLFENNGTATIASNDGTGRLTITIQSSTGPVTIPFWVLNSDYNDYALAYGCVNINAEQRRVYSWKLSRTKALSSTANTVINNRINDIQVLDSRYYENVNQSDSACFYLPDLSPGDAVIFPGQCDQNVPVIRNFDPVRYAGRWRLIETYQTDFQRGTCIDATYTLLQNGTVLVQNSEVINQALDTIDGTATLGSTDGSGKLLVNFPNAPQAEYWILDTDYDSYSLVYNCVNLQNNQRRVWSWKLSKTRELTPAANNNMNAIINTIDVLDARYYQNVDQSDAACFYYPVPDGNPVIFRGQCDENITVVTNFRAADYLNTWYDIESYPTVFQFGTCPSATYTLNGSVVDVYNTEVVNQQLSTVYGVAVPYPDGSARLNVSFPIPGTNLSTNSPYWVLTTDYTNYALVYSCVNVDEDHRSVYSWKLSRTKNLSTASNTAINNALNTIPVLRQKYYDVRGHTEEDCFFYPDNKGGPVILDGECAPSTIAVANFSLTSFAGTWYEVSRYPSELRSGECVSNEYVALANQNSFNLTKNFITYEDLNVASGSATVSPDGRGILDVKLTDNNGVSYETTMYVMDINYNDYALLYGCRNLGNNSKQIYSWKLSRNQAGLSSQAVTNINRIVSDTRDLFEGYYEETDQTLSGCFYYPDFESTPEQIVLPGPCNETIRGIPNFNAVGYLGKWYEIASYPQAFQDGDCARAYYSTTDGVVVSVMNTQVTNRTLDVAYATAVVASTDGSGVLNVTFNFPGFSTLTNYYILATDYTDYALVYSCSNVNDGKSRQVTSWKLSRTKTLSPQAEAAMTTVINNTQGLLERFYTTTNQSDEACFYIPEVDRDQAPIFRGQCDDVQGVQGFNAQRYIGWWHEVEAYPTDTDSGSCISSDFRAFGTAYQIVETSVRRNNATVIVSNVTVSNNGRLRKTYSDGRFVDLWVLATDYETYSLLYSCENINSDYKRVWSAKHSKRRSLTQAAQNAISEVIANRRVLEPQFYLPVDQSDGVCFHYPELTGDQVILPGQCDQNIPVERQFDAAQYTGTWYQIQRYPQRFERGNCTGARYTLNTDTGVVTLLNWEVVDGVLDTIEGNAVVSSVDGSARLTVNLPIRGTSDTEPPMTSMELYVLTTDYLSYSLAYSCVNIDPYRRAVATWKLSRTRTMTAAGDAAINTYMANREEFYNDYFITVEQSDECPEPSSAILIKSSLIVFFVSIALLYLF